MFYQLTKYSVAFENFLEKVVKNRYVRKTPILVLENKIDKKSCEEFEDFWYNIKHKSSFPHYQHFLVSAKTRMNVTNAFDWLINEIERNTDQASERAFLEP